MFFYEKIDKDNKSKKVYATPGEKDGEFITLSMDGTNLTEMNPNPVLMQAFAIYEEAKKAGGTAEAWETANKKLNEVLKNGKDNGNS